MKTLVVGMFDDVQDARRVLLQLADSPLDRREVTVLHRDPEVQADLQAAGGIPNDRSTAAAAAIGAVLGAAIGVVLTPFVPALGLALNAAAGALLGAVVATVLTIAASPLKIPPDHQTQLADGLEAGATVVIVRADSMPTAEAIGDLFRSSNARDLGPIAGAAGPAAAGSDVPTDGVAAPVAPEVAEDQLFRRPQGGSEGGGGDV